MQIVVASAFRNAAYFVPRYLDQIVRLRDVLRTHTVRVLAVEGDSSDDTTRRSLTIGAKAWDVDLQLVECHHGGPEFGSTESPERMEALSLVSNTIFANVRHDDDILVYVESDLRWDPSTIAVLIDEASQGQYVIAPLVFAGALFYDVWGFRGLDGQRFSPFAPYHSSLEGHPNEVVEIASAGSCLVMPSNIGASVRIPDDNALVGWCGQARRQGYFIGVHTGLRIQHP